MQRQMAPAEIERLNVAPHPFRFLIVIP
jgi:hypothetical protein